MRPFGLVSALIVAILAEGDARSQDLPQSPPTARDVYVSCSLLVRNTDVSPSTKDGRPLPYSSTVCSLYALAAMGLREGKSAAEDNGRRWCLPKDAQSQQKTLETMAYAYIDVFESHFSRMASGPGREAFLAAMIVKWPCK